jgi:hypothetical protein
VQHLKGDTRPIFPPTASHVPIPRGLAAGVFQVRLSPPSWEESKKSQETSTPPSITH